MELIDRDALTEKLSTLDKWGLYHPIDFKEFVLDACQSIDPLDVARAVIQYQKDDIAREIGYRLVEVDAVPVRPGRWECGKPCPCCGEDRFKGLYADIWADWEPPYCPNCGADMREVEHETD